ncbi:jg3114 [Pararge aegeria aegeria]|uniref:Jg3114 protein n=1 Tax=Pararge aegeria aegeria TaxID=348720 RepID=A0A8S4RFS1_9NEOP|nr:jg3114 [Pararge aegeria aegeria]
MGFGGYKSMEKVLLLTGSVKKSSKAEGFFPRYETLGPRPKRTSQVSSNAVMHGTRGMSEWVNVIDYERGSGSDQNAFIAFGRSLANRQCGWVHPL